MVTGPQQQRLETALAGASEDVVAASAREWRRCANLLNSVAMALEHASGLESSLGGQTGPAMAKAFRTSAKGMRAKQDELIMGNEALGVAHGAIVAARVGKSEMNHYYPQPPNPGPYRPPPGPKDGSDLPAQTQHQEKMQSFSDAFEARENIARQLADRIDTDFGSATETMKAIHGIPDPEQPATPADPSPYVPPSGGLPPGGSTRPPRTTDHASIGSNPHHGIQVVPPDDNICGFPPPPIQEVPVHEPPTEPPGLQPTPTTTQPPGLPPGAVPTTPGGPGAIGGGGGSGGFPSAAAGAIAGGGLAGAAVAGIRGAMSRVAGVHAATAGSAAGRPIGASSRAGAAGALGRGAAASPGGGAGAGRGAGGRGAAVSPGGGAGGRGAGGRGAAGGRGVAGGGAGGRGGAAAAGTGRGRGKDEQERRGDRDLFDDGQDWIDDADAAPGVID
ncbi:hypothetical protein [Nocardioides sp. cx-173]|uniref:hypothetical protein n=1 Tax=Nocardioides sp. cx-173 TaxID=2898796 RepID=UPI001E60F6DC|nr:hypothetical protein [Nocardioides sp. cx-173]MCD4524657.1 hypothetical protein [Nocardioides sp. cx-173]UGB42863.1 hypothetical protein LQ940_04890 [Nocardioides sp. cx-173]